MPYLKEAQGYVVVIGSGMAQLRFPRVSDYTISKFTVNRLVEYIALGALPSSGDWPACELRMLTRVIEYKPEVKAFCLHPGTIRTGVNFDSPQLPTPDTTDLPAATMLYLTAGNADWLSGRYVMFRCISAGPISTRV